MRRLLSRLLDDLRSRSLSFDLGASRPDAITVMVFVPGHRYEVEFFEDGHVEIEPFSSSGEIFGEEAVAEVLSFGGEPREPH